MTLSITMTRAKAGYSITMSLVGEVRHKSAPSLSKPYTHLVKSSCKPIQKAFKTLGMSPEDLGEVGQKAVEARWGASKGFRLQALGVFGYGVASLRGSGFKAYV